MGYGWNTRSSQAVQMQSRHYFTFESIAKHYESITPLRGKRKDKNIRPVGERNRDWERVVKFNDNEYYLTSSAWRWYDDPQLNTHDKKPQRLMSFKRIDGGETFTLHTPKYRSDRLDPHSLSVPSTFYFIYYNMPKGLSFHNEKSCKYVRTDHDNKFYIAEKGDITFSRLDGETEWKPFVVHREVIHHTDRAKTKAIRQQMKPFLDYSNIMFDMLEHKRWYGSLFKQDDFSDYTWEDIVKPLADGSPNPLWVSLVEHLKSETRFYDYDTSTYSFNKNKVKSVLYKAICYVARPHKEVEIPLGTTCRDPFKTMYI